MTKKIFVTGAVILTLLALLLNMLGGCGDGEEATAPTTTAALPEENVTDSIRDDAFTYDIYKTYAEVSSYIARGAVAIVPRTVSGLPVKSIGDSAFASNTVLTRVTLPDSVVNIGVKAFFGCTSLQSVQMNGVRAIGVSAFQNSGLCEVTLPRTLGSLDHYAFAGTQLKTVTLNGELPIVGEYTFANCPVLESVIFREGVNLLSSHMFYNCPALREVQLHSSMKKIGDYAFSACPSLDSLYLPSSVTELGNGILYGSESTVILTPAGSAAQAYCEKTGLTFRNQDNP